MPIYTSSPGDSSIGMNVAALALEGNKCTIDPNLDVNETASIVLAAKRGGGKSGVLICGGGSPKNFMLQTEPQIQEVLGIDEKGHDYFLQITDARPDTGGLSGATPAEAVSWGKIDPDRLPDAVVCYLDSTVALPLLTCVRARAPRQAPAQAPVRSARREHDERLRRGVRTRRTRAGRRRRATPNCRCTLALPRRLRHSPMGRCRRTADTRFRRAYSPRDRVAAISSPPSTRLTMARSVQPSSIRRSISPSVFAKPSDLCRQRTGRISHQAAVRIEHPHWRQRPALARDWQ